MSKFAINGNKGFSITFANGVRVSVQFGSGNYCDNYDRKWDDPSPARSINAEVAIIDDQSGNWLTRELVPEADDDVLARIDADALLELMTKSAAWKPK